MNKDGQEKCKHFSVETIIQYSEETTTDTACKYFQILQFILKDELTQTDTARTKMK